MEVKIRDLTLRDELTGLYNLRGFTILGEHAVRVAQRSQQPLSVLYVDLDNLKHINDTLGHTIGSAFLHETAELLKETFRETDVIGRIGGDEFAVVCQCAHVAISIAAERLQEASRERNAQGSHVFPLTFSIGYATAEEHGQQTLNELMTEADRAMYEQKREKKLLRS
jgi:diguanylate cyclase (GGDEF)-like protein